MICALMEWYLKKIELTVPVLTIVLDVRYAGQMQLARRLDKAT